MKRLILIFGLIICIAFPVQADIGAGVTSANCDSTTLGTTSGSVDFESQWTAETYSIRYTAGSGGSGSDQNQSVTYNSTFTTKAADTFSKANATFDAWSPSSGSYTRASTQYTYTTTSSITLTATWVCNAGYTLSGTSCVACGAGYYKGSTGNGACTKCPTAYPNTDTTTATAVTQCYSGTKSRSWSGSQTECSNPDTTGCSGFTCGTCSNPACDYVAYSNSAGTGDGTIKSGCSTNNAACQKPVASVTAKANYYANGTSGCPSCSGATDGKYTLSAAGANKVGKCYLTLSAGKQVASAGAGSSNCSAGRYCTSTGNIYYNSDGGTTTYTGTQCVAGSYSTAGSSSCTACGAGKTSSAGATASSSCTNCSTIVGSSGWESTSWNSSNNTMTNLCTISGCQANYYKSGNTCPTCSSKDSNYPYSDGGAISYDKCYKNVTRSCTQNNCSNPDTTGCASVTCASSCSCAGNTYILYADGTTSGTTSESCTKGVSSLSAKANYYVNGTTSCPACNVSFTDSGSDTTSTSTCANGSTTRANATATSQTFTRTCYHQTSAGGAISSGSCTGTQSCGTKTYGTCTITACAAGYYLANASDTSCTAVGSGYYSAAGETARHQCPTAYPNTDTTTSAAVTSCYVTKTATCTQNNCSNPDTTGCSSYTCASSCSCTGSTYKQYSNAAGNGNGSTSGTTSESCTRAVASLSAKANYYVNGTSSCPACSSFSSTYTKSDGGNISSNYCYKVNTNTGSQLDPDMPAEWYSRSTSACTPGTCTYKDYYNATDGSCTPTNCTKGQTATACKAGYYLSDGACPACSGLASGFYPNSANGNSSGAGACYTNTIRGQYVKASGDSSATNCGADTRYKGDHTVNYGSTSTCSDVSSGYYSTGGTSATRTGQSQCTAGYYCSSGVRNACASGKYSSTSGATSCSNITAGYYCAGGAKTATPSSTSDSVTGAACGGCSGRNSYSGAGAGSCSAPGDGYYTTGCNSSGNLCTGRSACGDGNYCKSGVSTACTTTTGWATATGTTTASAYTSCYQTQTPSDCASGTITRTASSISGTTITYGTASVTTALSANAGYYVNGTACSACGGNAYYCAGGTAARKSVDTGYYSTGGTETTRSGQSQCTAGYYCSSGVRNACAGGKYSSTSGATSCSNITAGYYCAGGAKTATPSSTSDSVTGAACGGCSGRTKYSGAGAASCSTVSDGYYTTGCNSSNNLCTNQSQCTSGTWCASGVANNCSSLSGVSPSGGTYSSAAGSTANTACKYTAPSKTITGCKTVTSQAVTYSGSAWPASTYGVTATTGYVIANNNTSSATCTKCAAGTYQGTDGSTSTSCSACTGRTKYSGAGAASCSTVTAGYYTTGCTSNNNCTGQSQCTGTTYCVDGVQNDCPNATTYKRTNFPDNYYSPTITSTSLQSQNGLTAITQCLVLSWMSGTRGSLYEYAKYNSSTSKYDTTTSYGWHKVNAGYYLTDKAGCGAYAYYATVAVCPAGSYCPGKDTVVCNESNQSTVHTTNFGLESCPTAYPNSASGSTKIGQCYLTTTSTKYVASQGAGQVTCACGGYCPGGTTVYYNSDGGTTTGGWTACGAGKYNGSTGSSASSACSTASAGYYASSSCSQTACAGGKYSTGGASTCSDITAGYFCAGGAKTATPSSSSDSATGAACGNCASSNGSNGRPQYSSAGASSCTECPAVSGTLASRATSYAFYPAVHTAITGCYAYFTDSDDAATFNTLCYYNATDGGYGGTNSSCQTYAPTACAVGKYNTIASTTEWVSAGNYASCKGVDCMKGKVCTTTTAGYYSAEGATTQTACATGSYSSAGSGTCTACIGGKKNTGTGNTSCSTDCSSITNLATWKTPSWSANSVSNLCTVATCNGCNKGTGAATCDYNTTGNTCNYTGTCLTGYSNPTASSNTINCTANTYTVSYTLNSGTAGSSAPTSATFDTAFTVSNPTRSGYTFAGWKITGMDSVTHYYGSATTTGISISWTKETSFKNLRSTSGTVTFEAQWCANCSPTNANCSLTAQGTSCSYSSSCKGGFGGLTNGTAYNPSCSQCAAGTASADGNNTCSVCGDNKWSNAQASSCSDCASGYSNSGNTAASHAGSASCKITVSAGHYISTSGQNSSNWATCAAGYYKASHEVAYGSTSGCDKTKNNYYNTGCGTNDSGAVCSTNYSGGACAEYATATAPASYCTCNANYVIGGGANTATYSTSDRSGSTCALKTYTITLKKNGGNGKIGGDTTVNSNDATITCTHGVSCSLPVYSSTTLLAKGTGATSAVFLGWSTSNTATSATYTSSGTFTSATTLYAVWVVPTCSGNSTSVASTSLNSVSGNAPVCNRSSKDGYYCSATQTGSAGATSLTTSCSAADNGYYAKAGDTTQTECAIGSYSSASSASSSCTACPGGRTTSGKHTAYNSNGNTACSVDCAGITHLATWATPSWSANSVSNLCTVATCDTCAKGTGVASCGYTTTGNTCNYTSTCSTGYSTSGGTNTGSTCTGYNCNCVARTYTVTYAAGTGGTGSISAGTATYDSTFTPATPSSTTIKKSNATFAGWSVSGTSDTKSSGFKWTYTENKTFTAMWSCDAGYTLNSSTGACEACADGTYKTSSGNGACSLCSDLASGYTHSDGTRTAATNCYLNTSSGNYVATQNSNQTTCAADGYCPGSVKVSYGSTGGRTACTSPYSSSAAGSDDENDCYLTTSQKMYVASTGQGQTDCTAGYYCPGGSVIYKGGTVSGRNTTGGRSGCSAGNYCPAKSASAIACSTLGGRLYTNSAANSDEATDCYITLGAKTYLASASSTAVSDCPAGSYCGGGNYYYSSTATNQGLAGCPANSYCPAKSASATACTSLGGGLYNKSAANSDEATDCYITLSSKTYLASASSTAVSDCPAGSYCGGGNYNYSSTATNQGLAGCPAGSYCPAKSASATSCTAPYSSSAAGSDDENDCYLTTSQKMYVDQAGQGQVDCTAGYYCPGGSVIYKGGTVSGRNTTGGRTGCPVDSYCEAKVASATTCSSATSSRYTKSAAGSSKIGQCYLVTDSTKYVASQGAGQVTCACGGYCGGGTTVYYNSDGGSTTGGWTGCGAGKYNSSTGSSGSSACSTASAGYYANSACSQTAVNAGYYSTGGGTSATPSSNGNGCTGTGNTCGLVSAGYYNTGAGTNSTGSVASGSGKSGGLIDAGYYGAAGATSSTGTGLVSAGYYSTGGGTSATPSSNGNGCTGTGKTCGLVSGGYYSTGGGTSATPSSNGNGCTGTGNTCGKLSAAYYSNGGSTSDSGSCISGRTCGTCDSNYRANTNTGKTAVTDCTISCGAGTAVLTKNGACAVVSGSGYKTGTATVAYGSTSPTAADITSGWASGTIYNCPTGYGITGTAATNHDERTDCTISCGAGTRVASANEQCTTPAGNWYTTATHTVSAGSTSGTSCPTGYGITGTATTDHDAKSDCTISCGAGTRVATADAQCTTPAGNWYTTATHTVSAGSTSGTSCPTGYSISGTATTDHDAKSDCTISCGAGTRVATADAQCTTPAGNWYTTATHTVSAGSTSGTSCINGYTISGTTAEDHNEAADCKISCGAGYYIPTAGEGCQACPGGKYCSGATSISQTATSAVSGTLAAEYYCAGGAKTSTPSSTSDSVTGDVCGTCDSNYRANTETGKTDVAQCKTSCSAGYAVVTTGSACISIQNASYKGKYTTQHTVSYGSKTTISTCPANYQEANGTTAQSNCETSCSAGYAVQSTNGACTAVTTDDKYTSSHNVKYGNTSTLSTCNTTNGYHNSGTTYDKHANQSSCKVTCSAGKQVASSGAACSTPAGSWYTSEHVVSEGSTSGSNVTSCVNSNYTTANTTTQTDHDASNDCKASCSAGYAVQSTNGACTAVTTDDKYTTSHSVSQGSTSTLSTCNTTNGYHNSGTTYDKHANESSCKTTCSAGTYVATARGACGDVGNGYYRAGSEVVSQGDTGTRNVCSSLASDYTNSDNGRSAATTCYLNTTSTKFVKTQNANQVSCDAGGYCPGSVKVYYGSTGGRTACSCGTYNPNTGSDASSACVSTGGGYYANGTGNSGQTKADAGYYAAAGSCSQTACSTLGGGLYTNSAAGSDEATDCYITLSSKTYLASASSTAVSDCPAGSYCGGGNYNYSSTATNQGLAGCPAGSYCPAKSASATACTAPYSSSAAGSDDANDCYLVTSPSKYVASAGQGQTDCAAGGYCSGGSTIYVGGTVSGRATTGGRTACDAGTYNASTGSSSSNACVACVNGSYSASAGSTACTACSGGKKNTGSGNTSCITDCGSITNLATWKTPAWKAADNTMSTGTCLVDTCNGCNQGTGAATCSYNTTGNTCNYTGTCSTGYSNPAASNTTINCTANSHTISYSCGTKPGSTSMTGSVPAQQQLSYDGTYNLRSNTCEYKGYSFGGWSCDYNLGTGAHSANNYSAGASSTFKVDANVVCTATWTANPISVKWYQDSAANGVDTPFNTGTCSYDDNLSLPTNYEQKKGYTFKGWKVRQEN